MTELTTIGARFRAAAEIEAKTPITVGTTTVGFEARAADRGGTGWLALAKLAGLWRRQCRLSVEELADRAGVDLEEVVRIERGEGGAAAHTVRQIARVLNLPESKLLELVGLAEGRDDRLREATVRITARSEPTADLLPEERAALEEYVKVLAES